MRKRFNLTINLSTVKVLSFALIIVWLLPSCKVTKPYQRPAIEDDLKYYRADQVQTDTTGIDILSWRRFFTDPILLRYIETGLSNNLDIRIAAERIKAANAYLLQGRAAYLPTLSAGPEVGFQSPSLNTFPGNTSTDRASFLQYSIGASVSWEADLWGKLKSNERAALAEYLRTEAARQSISSVLVSEIADTYYRLLALDEQKKLVTNTISNRESSLETTKALKDAGSLTAVAVKQSEAQLLREKGLLISTNYDIKLLENYFSILLSKSPDVVTRSSVDTLLTPRALIIGVPAHLLRNRPDVFAAEYDFASAFELTNVARTYFYPTLRLTAGTGILSADIDQLFSVGSIFGNIVGGLTQPILDRRQNKTRLEVSQANQQAAYLNYKKVLLQASREVSDALFSYDTQVQLTDLKRQEFETYNVATEYAQELVNYGLANYLEVLLATDNSLSAELDYINAKYGVLRARIGLYQALGGGWK